MYFQDLYDNSVIAKKAPNGCLIEEGNYTFLVAGISKEGPVEIKKVGQCYRLVLLLYFRTQKNEVIQIVERIPLNRMFENRLVEFFCSIGEIKPCDTTYYLDFSKIMGTMGRATVGVKTIKNRSGRDKTINYVKSFIAEDEGDI